MILHECEGFVEDALHARGGLVAPNWSGPLWQANPAPADAKELILKFKSAPNLKTAETGHSHKLVLDFEHADHINENWTWRQNGKDTPMIFHFARKKS